MTAILGLTEGASAWLSEKGTDQWQRPWPNERRRDARIRRGLKNGVTYIVWAANRAVATVTMETKPQRKVWKGAECDLSEPAVYLHRLMVARDFSGYGLGAQLVDWTGLCGDLDYGARWIRLDAWSTNLALHRYYMARGFEFCGQCPDRKYPSGMRFQKSVQSISRPDSPLFADWETPVRPFADYDPVGSGALSPVGAGEYDRMYG